MKFFTLPCMALGMFLMATGCQTKVVNQPPAAGNTTVIEKDRPVVTERQVDRPIIIDRDKPDVQNNIKVER